MYIRWPWTYLYGNRYNRVKFIMGCFVILMIYDAFIFGMKSSGMVDEFTGSVIGWAGLAIYGGVIFLSACLPIWK